MRKILLFLLVIVSFQAFGQNPTNYQYRVVRERSIAAMFDSSLHIPRYNGTPVGLRVGSSTQDGLIAMDTLNNLLYIYSGGVWAASGSNFANANLTFTGNRAHDANYKSLAVTKLLSGHWKAGTGVNYMDEAYDSTYHAMVVNKGSDFYGWEANATTGNKFMKLYANTSIVQAEPDSIILSQASGDIRLKNLIAGSAADSVLVIGIDGKIKKRDGASLGSNLIFEESVIESNDSVFLEGEKIYTPTTNTVYGRDNANNPGYHAAAVINLTNVKNKHFLNYQNGEWVNSNEFREMVFRSGDADYTEVGDSIMADTAFQDMKLNVFREGELQWKVSGYEPYSYEHTNDTIIFHPPLATGERINIQVYDTLQWNTITHYVPPAWEDLTFTTNTNLTNTSQVFTTSGGPFGFGHTGLDNLYLPAGQDGFIVMQYTASDGVDAVLGFNTTNSEQGFVNFEAAIDIGAGGDVYRIDGAGGSSTITSCTGIATGTWVGINRTGSTLKVVKKTGALSGTLADWTVCYTFTTFTSSADLFVVCDIYSTGKMYTPQGWNLQ